CELFQAGSLHVWAALLHTRCSSDVITMRRLRDTGLTSASNNVSMREILIAGLGSIGRRHLASLRALGWTAIRLFRTGHSTLSDAELAGIPVDYDLATALARRPLAVIVSNPSALHIPLALDAARARAHLFIEKPLSHDLKGVDELESLVVGN